MSSQPHHSGPRAARKNEPHDAAGGARHDHAHGDHGHHHGHDLSGVKPARRAAKKKTARKKRGLRRRLGRLRRRTALLLRQRTVRRLIVSLTLAAAVVMVAGAGLWWRLNSGPIELDIATPWLKQAIEENFGAGDRVSVGGTQIERDERGRTSLRLRDIEVRNAEGVIVASAPKAEVGLSGFGLLYGRVRAQSLNLVGAAMSIRIETDGRVTVFAGGEERPIVTAPPTVEPARKPPPSAGPQDAPVMETPRAAFADLAGILTWIDNVGASGLDGHELREVGLKNGSLLVDDRRTGKRLTFDRINASLTRPEQGGVVFRLESVNPERPWIISAAMRPLADGVRALGLEARKVSARDLLLAARLDSDGVDVDLPISASVRAEVGGDGKPNVIQGEIFTDPGSVVDRGKQTVRYDVERIEARFNWDQRRGNLIVPFQIHMGSNQFTLRATVEPPAQGDTAWKLEVTRGDPVIDPVILGASRPTANDGLALNRVNIRARIDPTRKRFDLDQGDLSRVDNRPLFNVAVAVTGSLDFSAEPHIAFGVAGTRMTLPIMMKLWPAFAAREVRDWVEGHISSGIVERVVVAGNAPISNFKDGGPPTPEDGLSVDIETSATTLRPVEDLPDIRDADLTVRVTGVSATVNLGRGTVEVAGGRKLNVASGVFSIPNTHAKPSPSITTFRADGTVPAAAALLASDALRDKMGLTIDPATSRGTLSAQVTIRLPLAKHIPEDATNYAIDADLQNFAADKLVLGQKIEAQALKVNASNTGYSIKGDVKINGTAARIDMRRAKGDDSAQLSLTASIDEAARKRLGLDLGASVSGTIPIKATGTVGDNVKDERLNVEADLTAVKIDNLLPGWVKPAGKPARATYAMIKSANRTRFEDVAIDGGGASVRGTVEVDANGHLTTANFPTFALSDGDKLSVKADRGDNGALKVLMRGDVFDGRNFVKSSLAGADEDPKSKQMDLDLDIRIGAVAGHNGETLRGLDLKLSRRGGQIRSFNLGAKIGRDTPLSGDLRMRARDNHRVVYLETDDAGSLFRFTDTYPRIFGGRMWLAMDPPTQEQTPQIGTIVVRDFVVRGEPALDRIVATSGASGPQGVGFAEASAGFTKTPGRMSVRDGVVRGPLVGATVEGQVDYASNEIHLRGTFVPLYGLNNMFGLGQIPIVGLFLGGSNEGLLGITYEATGSPGAPRITVNPVSAIAPGLLRKFIPSPGTFDPKFMPAPQ